MNISKFKTLFSWLLIFGFLTLFLFNQFNASEDTNYVFERTVDVHIQNLNSEDPNVRAIGAYVLADIGD